MLKKYFTHDKQFNSAPYLPFAAVPHLSKA
jgi:hypothetical protein